MALAMVGGALAGVGAAGAAPAPGTITTVTSANVTCQLKAKVTLSPALKNNWVQADHASDPNPAVVAIPDTTYSTFGTTGLNVDKTTITKCAGTVTGNGTNALGVPTNGLTATIKKVFASLTPLTPATPGEISCVAFFDEAEPGDVQATYTNTMTFQTKTNNLAPTTVSGFTITPGGLGFVLSGGTVTGSFAGGNVTAAANIDKKTVSAVFTTAPSSTAPKGTSPLEAIGIKTNPNCHAKLKAKGEVVTPRGVKPATASLKAPPKGFTTIKVGKDIISGGPSTITLTK